MTEASPGEPGPPEPGPPEPAGEPEREPSEPAVEPGPPEPERRRAGRDAEGNRTPLASLARGLAGLLSALIFVTAVGGFGVYHHFDSRIHRVSLRIGGQRPAPAVNGTVNYLLVGADSRAGTNGEYGDVGGERSDTTILAHLDKDGTTTMVSFPRDLWVDIPGHGLNKLNSAISTGGPSLLGQTLEQLTNIKIDHYVSIDLAGFKALTNAVGGVTVCLLPLTAAQQALGADNLHDSYSGWNGHVGENKLTGDQALGFVRQRYGLPNGDLDRIKRQQQFIGAVFRETTSGGVLTSPSKLEGVLATATSALTVDSGTSISDLRQLATRVRGLDASKIRFETVPTYFPTRAQGAIDDSGEILVNGQKTSVEYYDPAQLAAFLAPLRGEPTTAGTNAAGTTTAGTTTAGTASAEPSRSSPSAQVSASNETGSSLAGVKNLTSTAPTAAASPTSAAPTPSATGSPPTTAASLAGACTY